MKQVTAWLCLVLTLITCSICMGDRWKSRQKESEARSLDFPSALRASGDAFYFDEARGVYVAHSLPRAEYRLVSSRPAVTLQASSAKKLSHNTSLQQQKPLGFAEATAKNEAADLRGGRKTAETRQTPVRSDQLTIQIPTSQEITDISDPRFWTLNSGLSRSALEHTQLQRAPTQRLTRSQSSNLDVSALDEFLNQNPLSDQSINQFSGSFNQLSPSSNQYSPNSDCTIIDSDMDSSGHFKSASGWKTNFQNRRELFSAVSATASPIRFQPSGSPSHLELPFASRNPQRRYVRSTSTGTNGYSSTDSFTDPTRTDSTSSLNLSHSEYPDPGFDNGPPPPSPISKSASAQDMTGYLRSRREPPLQQRAEQQNDSALKSNRTTLARIRENETSLFNSQSNQSAADKYENRVNMWASSRDDDFSSLTRGFRGMNGRQDISDNLRRFWNESMMNTRSGPAFFDGLRWDENGMDPIPGPENYSVSGSSTSADGAVNSTWSYEQRSFGGGSPRRSNVTTSYEAESARQNILDALSGRSIPSLAERRPSLPGDGKFNTLPNRSTSDRIDRNVEQMTNEMTRGNASTGFASENRQGYSTVPRKLSEGNRPAEMGSPVGVRRPLRQSVSSEIPRSEVNGHSSRPLNGPNPNMDVLDEFSAPNRHANEQNQSKMDPALKILSDMQSFLQQNEIALNKSKFPTSGASFVDDRPKSSPTSRFITRQNLSGQRSDSQSPIETFDNGLTERTIRIETDSTPGGIYRSVTIDRSMGKSASPTSSEDRDSATPSGGSTSVPPFLPHPKPKHSFLRDQALLKSHGSQIGDFTSRIGGRISTGSVAERITMFERNENSPDLLHTIAPAARSRYRDLRSALFDRWSWDEPTPRSMFGDGFPVFAFNYVSLNFFGISTILVCGTDTSSKINLTN